MNDHTILRRQPGAQPGTVGDIVVIAVPPARVRPVGRAAPTAKPAPCREPEKE